MLAEMANQEHLDILAKGVEAWNAWRKQNSVAADLSHAELGQRDLSRADFSRVDLSQANLSGAYLG